MFPLICSEDSVNMMLYCQKYDGVLNFRACIHVCNCTENAICPHDMQKCPSSYCIPDRMLCDENIDCPNGEDELNCGEKTFYSQEVTLIL